MSNIDKIVWIDVETTGLGTPVTEDHLLEIGFRVTDREGDFLEDALYLVPNPRHYYFNRLCANDFVRTMHEKSGLASEYDDWIAYLREARVDYHQAYAELEENMTLFFQDQVEPGAKVILAGSSVDFDRSWLKAYFPEICATYVSHRVLDVSSVLEFCKILNPDLYKKYKEEESNRPPGKHRPQEDLTDTIWKYQFMMENFMHVYFDTESE